MTLRSLLAAILIFIPKITAMDKQNQQMTSSATPPAPSAQPTKAAIDQSTAAPDSSKLFANIYTILGTANWAALEKKEEPYEYSPTCPWPNRFLMRGHFGDLMSHATPPFLNTPPATLHPELHSTDPMVTPQQLTPDSINSCSASTDTNQQESDDWLGQIRTSEDVLMQELFDTMLTNNPNMEIAHGN